MRIGFYSPYFPTMGGGERYLLALAAYYSKKHDVSLVMDPTLTKRVYKTFGFGISEIKVIPAQSFLSLNALQRYKFLGRFGVFFYTTDGSVFFSASKKNYLVIQSPLHIPSENIVNSLKMHNWYPVCYSNFMKEIIMTKLGRDALVVPPAVDNGFFAKKKTEKRNIILTVGRFFPYPHNKNQEVLAQVFNSFTRKALSGWRLVIAGGLTESGGKSEVEKLKKLSENSAIELKVNIGIKELLTLYQNAKIYWHAAGYGQDTLNYPERAEHFGITTLEAMAAGVVPIVYPAGGQTELVQEGKNGYHWENVHELIEKTVLLIQDEKLRTDVSLNAINRARLYSTAKLQPVYENLLD